MTKQENATRADSCWGRAKPEEQVFVLLERDVAAPATIRFWAEERVRTGKNGPQDPEIVRAYAEAHLIDVIQERQAAEKQAVGQGNYARSAAIRKDIEAIRRKAAAPQG